MWSKIRTKNWNVKYNILCTPPEWILSFVQVSKDQTAKYKGELHSLCTIQLQKYGSTGLLSS